MVRNKGEIAYVKPKKVHYLHIKNIETMLNDVTDFLMHHTMQYYAEDESFYEIRTKPIKDRAEYTFQSISCSVYINSENSKECYIVFETPTENDMFICFKVYNPSEFYDIFKI